MTATSGQETPREQAHAQLDELADLNVLLKKQSEHLSQLERTYLLQRSFDLQIARIRLVLQVVRMALLAGLVAATTIAAIVGAAPLGLGALALAVAVMGLLLGYEHRRTLGSFRLETRLLPPAVSTSSPKPEHLCRRLPSPSRGGAQVPRLTRVRPPLSSF